MKSVSTRDFKIGDVVFMRSLHDYSTLEREWLTKTLNDGSVGWLCVTNVWKTATVEIRINSPEEANIIKEATQSLNSYIEVSEFKEWSIVETKDSLKPKFNLTVVPSTASAIRLSDIVDDWGGNLGENPEEFQNYIWKNGWKEADEEFIFELGVRVELV